METETPTAEAPLVLCACTDLEHEPTCPANPDPFLCDWCREPYDPEAVDHGPACTSDHCADCGSDCRDCWRFAGTGAFC